MNGSSQKRTIAAIVDYRIAHKLAVESASLRVQAYRNFHDLYGDHVALWGLPPQKRDDVVRAFFKATRGTELKFREDWDTLSPQPDFGDYVQARWQAVLQPEMMTRILDGIRRSLG